MARLPRAERRQKAQRIAGCRPSWRRICRPNEASPGRPQTSAKSNCTFCSPSFCAASQRGRCCPLRTSCARPSKIPASPRNRRMRATARVDYSRELGPVFVLASLPQAQPCLLRRKPGATSPRLLWIAQSRHFTEMSVDCKFFFAGSRASFSLAAPLAPNISRERSLFDPPMHSRFLERLQRGRLGVGQSRFSAALGKSPPPAAASPNQQELDLSTTHPIANRGHLLAFTRFA